MAWIKIISYEEAKGNLKKLFDRVKGPDNNVDNILAVHSLRPHTLTGHMALYKNVLHNLNNTLPKWYLETLGVYVSYLNRCDYCVDHHYAGLKRLVNDTLQSDSIYQAIKEGDFSKVLNPRQIAGMTYARKLTLDIRHVSENDIDYLKTVGFDDGEILEINQVVSYFNYANRTVHGLGVNTEGDIIGLSPNDSSDPDNWGHA